MTDRTDERGAGPDRSAIARYLRQREEFGEGAVLLETLGRADALRMVRGAGSRRAEPTLPVLERPGRRDESTGEARAARSPAPRSQAPEGASDELPMDHDALRTAAMGCPLCRLAENRTQVVFHDGSPDARLMVVGEAPGANEDETGVPFVGAAGRFLDLLLASVGLSRGESVYICNVIKCRPPGNRNPRPDEIAACSPYLRRQIRIVRPEVILAVGTFSAQLLTGKDIALGRIRGEVYSYEGTPLVATYHPAALLRNSRWIRPTWDDFQLLRQVMDSGAS